jgi:hypothetical protein
MKGQGSDKATNMWKKNVECTVTFILLSSVLYNNPSVLKRSKQLGPFFLFLVWLGFELRALHLQIRPSTAWTTTPVQPRDSDVAERFPLYFLLEEILGLGGNFTFIVCDLSYFLNYLSFWWYWGLNSGPIPWATLSALFCEGFFWDRVSQTICPGWLRTMILLICLLSS